MPEKPKPEILPGGTYHVINRGNNRRPVFESDEEYAHFLGLCQKYLEPVGYLHAYALLPDHFHLLVSIKPFKELKPMFQTKKGILGRTFGHLQNAYAKWHQHRHPRQVSGLFEKRYERHPIEDDDYFRNTVNYLHRNGVKHGLVDKPDDWPWSSYHILKNPKEESWLARQRVWDVFGENPG